MGDVSLIDTVQIALANVQRVHTQHACDIAHDAFNHDHALRAAKAAKSGVALGVGFQAVGRNVNVLQKVGVVGMENGAVRHRA